MKSKLIFSAFKTDSSMNDNITKHRLVKQILKAKGIEYNQITGKYKNETELSLIVDWEYWSVVKELCLETQQECFMAINCNNEAALIDPMTEKSTLLGKFTEVTEKTAKSLDASSYDSKTDKFYAVV